MRKGYDANLRIVEVSAETGKIIEEFKSPDNQEAFQGTPDPTSRVTYCRVHRPQQKEALSLRDASNGKELALLPLGTIFNAAWLGPSFSDNGRWALAAAPYDNSLSVIDTAKRTVDRYFIFRESPAGAFLISPENEGEPGVILVITTSLPYE